MAGLPLGQLRVGPRLERDQEPELPESLDRTAVVKHAVAHLAALGSVEVRDGRRAGVDTRSYRVFRYRFTPRVVGDNHASFELGKLPLELVAELGLLDFAEMSHGQSGRERQNGGATPGQGCSGLLRRKNLQRVPAYLLFVKTPRVRQAMNTHHNDDYENREDEDVHLSSFI